MRNQQLVLLKKLCWQHDLKMEQEYEDQHRMYGYMLQFFQQHMLLIEEQYESQKQ